MDNCQGYVIVDLYKIIDNLFRWFTMNFFKILLFAFLVFSLNAETYGPVKVDTEGYIDDSKGELPNLNKVTEAPKVIETQPDPTKTDPNKSKVRKVPKVVETNTEPQPSQPPVNLDQFSTNDPPDGTMLYIIIGVVVVLIIAVVAFVIVKKGKNKKIAPPAPSKPNKPKNTVQQQTSQATSSSQQKIATNVQAESSRSSVSLPPTGASASAPQLPPTAAATSQNIAQANVNSLNQKGQNASGLIIDEDKYFASNDQIANDDFSDLDGPHSIQNQSNNG
jgi:hypothetical protein